MALGMTDGDWSGWYRLFSRGRYDELKTARVMLRETLQHTPIEQPYVVGTDGVQIPRSSLRMPGTGWMKAPRTPVFKVGIHRAQRYVHGAWLTPMEAGYSIPLRFLPAFPPKAKPAAEPLRREWEAGSAFLHWVRQELDEAGRAEQFILALEDGSYDTLNFWRNLPERTILAVRTARSRRLYYLPDKHPGRGRPARYGALAPHPCEWLHKGLAWQKRDVWVRGRVIRMKFPVLGPFVREGLPDVPLFLIVVKGMHRKVGKRRPHFKHRLPGQRGMATAAPHRTPARLALAALGARSRPSGDEVRLWRRRKTRLEPPRHHHFRPVECLRVCPAVVICLPNLGVARRTSHPHPLVAGRQTLVFQHRLATIPCCFLGLL